MLMSDGLWLLRWGLEPRPSWFWEVTSTATLFSHCVLDTSTFQLIDEFVNCFSFNWNFILKFSLDSLLTCNEINIQFFRQNEHNIWNGRSAQLVAPHRVPVRSRAFRCGHCHVEVACWQLVHRCEWTMGDKFIKVNEVHLAWFWTMGDKFIEVNEVHLAWFWTMGEKFIEGKWSSLGLVLNDGW